MSTWHSSEPDRVSGKAFTIQKVQAPVLTALGNTPMLTRADLEHPSCAACYRPTSDAAVGYLPWVCRVWRRVAASVASASERVVSLAFCTCGARFEAESRAAADELLDAHVELVHGPSFPGLSPRPEHSASRPQWGRRRRPLDYDAGGRL